MPYWLPMFLLFSVDRSENRFQCVSSALYRSSKFSTTSKTFTSLPSIPSFTKRSFSLYRAVLVRIMIFSAHSGKFIVRPGIISKKIGKRMNTDKLIAIKNFCPFGEKISEGNNRGANLAFIPFGASCGRPLLHVHVSISSDGREDSLARDTDNKVGM